MFLPGVLRPLPRGGESRSNIGLWSESSFTVVAGPKGAFLPEEVAQFVVDGRRWNDCVWFRPDPRAAPETISRLLAGACRHRWSSGDRPDEPNPPTTLPETIRRGPAGAVVVVELGSRSWRSSRRVLRDLRCASDEGQVRIVVTLEGRRSLGLRPRAGPVMPTDPKVAAGIPSRHRGHLLDLAGPRRALVHDVAEAARGRHRDAVLDAVAACSRPHELLDRLTGVLLDDVTLHRRHALQASLATGYWHPQLVTDPVAIEELRPWVIALEDGWGWLRPMWIDALRRRLDDIAEPASPDRPMTVPTPTASVPARRAPTTPGPPPPSAVGADRVSAPTAVLDVRLLGELDVRVDGLAVRRWRGTKGPAVLRFLLSRPCHACARDALIEEFWPDVAPELARNRLQVTVSGLRRSLREVTPVDIVTFVDGGYRIHPDVRVDLDVDRFEAALRRAGAAAGSGATDQALEGYRDAIGTYRGDFAADAPFESWTLIARESLRLSYIDALDRVCRLQLDAGRLDEAIATGQRMLETDPCREDAHRLLMDCYRRQDRTHQVARQYELCARVLKARLDVDPDPATTRLYRTALDRCTPLTSHDALG